MRATTYWTSGVLALTLLFAAYFGTSWQANGAGLIADAGATPASAAIFELHPRADDIVARRVWSGEEVDVLGRPSPDGRLLTAVDWITSGNLIVRDLRTGESRPVTSKTNGWATDEHALFSIVSHGGNRVAFQWWNPGTKEYEIHVADLTAGSMDTVYAPGDPARYVQPTGWTPDGRKLLVHHGLEDRTNQLAFLDLETGEMRAVRSFGWLGPTEARLSPDGRWIAYGLRRDDDPAVTDLHILSADGRTQGMIAASGNAEEVVGWLPGGGPLFYLSRSRGMTRLLAQELDNGRPAGPPQVVRSDMTHSTPMGAFDDGFLFSVAVDARQTRLAGVDLEAGRITSDFREVVQGRMERAVAPEWSPDGEHLYYVVNPHLGGLSFPITMAVRSVRTGAERRFPVPFGYITNLAPSPDGSRFAVQGYGREGLHGIYLMSASGDSVEILQSSGPEGHVRLPEWTPDGRAVVYSYEETDASEEEIVSHDLATGEPTTLYATSRLRGFALTPDGRGLAVSRHDPERPEDSEILYVDLATGAERELVRVTAPDAISNGKHLAWSPDGQHLLFVRGSTDPGWDGTRSLWTVSRKGGDARLIPTETWVARPRLSPDGRTLAGMVGVNRYEVWSVENLRDVVGSRSGIAGSR